MKITISKKNQSGDIPQYEFNDGNEASNFLVNIASKTDFEKSILVCFPIFRNQPEGFSRWEIPSILVSAVWDDIVTFIQEAYFSEFVVFNNDFDFAIFEFETFEEAFKYCIDLKEGF